LYEGSSKGISQAAVVHTAAQLQAQVYAILTTYQQPALIETFMPGREFTVAILGNSPALTVLPLVEVCLEALPVGAAAIYSYEAKWLWDTSEAPLPLLQCPAHISMALARHIQRLCCQAFNALQCRDWCRIDVRLDTTGQPQILELNPLPGILPGAQSHSCFPYAAAAARIPYPDLIRQVLTHACQRSDLA
jgi:D-alanine-D-alanine ligase